MNLNPFRSLWIWLLAPLPRVPGAPLRFRKKIDSHHLKTDFYAGSLMTGDSLFSGKRQPLPGLVYHDFRFAWKGQEYRVYWYDKWQIFQPRELERPFPVWIDPWDLSSVWFLNEEIKVNAILPEDDDEDDEDADEGPLVALDVHYDGDNSATAAAILFDHWQSAAPSGTLTATVAPIAPYEPGAFYKRELPCLLAVLDKLEEPPCVVVIDGYVTLGAEERDGLGMHLYRALGEKVPVVGVAKKRFEGTPESAELLRGDSKKPLYITAAGVPQRSAKAFIRWMHGEHRIPSMLTRADRLARDSTDAP